MRSRIVYACAVLLALAGCSPDSAPAPRAAPSPSATFDRGVCLPRGEDDKPSVRAVPCDDPAAFAEIIALDYTTGLAGALSEPACPGGTDHAIKTTEIGGAEKNQTFRAICAHNLKPPHPGDPGGGGGSDLVIGDCVRVEGERFAGEARCDGQGAIKPTHVVQSRTGPVCPPPYSTLVLEQRNEPAQNPMEREVACLEER